MRKINPILFPLSMLLMVLICGCKEQPRQAATPAPQLQDWRRWNTLAREFKPVTGKQGGQMVVTSFGAGAKTFNPITSTETSSFELLQFVFEGLTELDPATQEIKPCLALEWTLSADRKTYDFQLRQDVVWSDGTPFTADDVLFTFAVIFDKKNLANARDILTIKGKPVVVSKTGEYSVRITLPHPFTPLLKALVGTTVPIIPRHSLAPEQSAGTFSSTWETNTPPKEIIGTGPFTIDTYRPSEQVTLARNTHYWKKDSAGTVLPYLEKILFTYVKDRNAELLKFQNGESDYLEMRGEDYPILKPLEQQGKFTIYNLGPALGDLFFMFNQNMGISSQTGKPLVTPYKLKWFRLREFRQAVAHCVDKRQMINIVHNGLAQPQITPMNEAGGYFFNPGVRVYDYNIDSARVLLARAGFKDVNNDSVLEDPDGNRVEFTVNTNAGQTDRLKYCDIIRKDLQKVGIVLHVVPLEFNHIIDKLDHTFDWEAIVLGLTGTEEPHDGANVWQSGARNHLWFPSQTKPSTWWEARIDSIFDAGAIEPDRAKRKALYNQWQSIAAEQVPYIELVSPFRLFAVRTRFGNVNPAPAAEGMYFAKRKFFHNIGQIFVKE